MISAKTVAQVLFRNIEWKILSLLLAALVWVAIYREPVISSVLSAPVQFKSAPANLEISSDITEEVTLEIRGSSGLLRNLSEKRVAVVLDFSHVRNPGERTFTIERKDTNLPSGVELVAITPSQLRFTFEHRVVREVVVDPQVSGALPKGLRLVSLIAKPAELAITGPESEVDAVRVLRTDRVDLKSVTEDENVHVTAYVQGKHIRFQDSPEVTVTVSVAK